MADAVNYPEELRSIARDMLIYEGDCREVDVLNQAADLIERLTPKPMTMAREIVEFGAKLVAFGEGLSDEDKLANMATVLMLGAGLDRLKDAADRIEREEAARA